MNSLKRIFILFTVLIAGMGTAVAAPPRRVVLADAKGSWGFPSPYLHIPKGPGLAYTGLVFDTLVTRDKTGALVPALAKSWQWSSKNTSWTFRLRTDAKWHDLARVTPEDVIFTVEYTKTHLYPYADTRQIIRAEKVGPDGVRLFLERPYAPFLEEVPGTWPASDPAPFVSKHLTRQKGKPCFRPLRPIIAADLA